MTFIWAFLIAGLFCALGQIILDNTKLTPGHVTSIFTVLGSILAFFGVYEKLIDLAGAGATTIIANFGYMLYIGALEGFEDMGVLGIFAGMLTNSSVAIVGSIVIASFMTLIFKPKD